jgi:Ran GTPase-activating protein (RanGAP) involved in mRNA processing and transport
MRHNRIDMEGVVEIAHALNVNLTLKVLDINCHHKKSNGVVPSDDDAAISFAGTLLVNESLVSLDLNASNFSTAGIKALTLALEKNCSLEKLGLLRDKYNRNYDDDSDGDLDDVARDDDIFVNDKVNEICNMLSTNNILTTLSLYNAGISTHDVKLIVNALQQNITLRILSLRMNRIEDDGAELIANMLKTNKTISDLDLSYNYIRSYGVHNIALALRQNNTIARLNLKCNRIYDNVSVDEMLLSLTEWNDTIIY